MSEMKTIRAGTGEKMQYIAHKFNDVTVHFALHYPGLLQPDVLCAAARAVVESVDVLHASFLSGAFGCRWRVCEILRDEDFFTLMQVDGDPMDTALQILPQSVPFEGPSQLRCTLILGKTDCAVVLSVSHLCADGSDAKYLLDKLTEAYNLIIEHGNADALAVKNGSRATEQMYAPLSRRQVLSQFRNPSTGVKTLFPFPGEGGDEPHLLHCMLPREAMARARKRAKSLNATANDLLLTACYRAYASLPGVDPAAAMSISSLRNLRHVGQLSDSEGLANLSGLLPTALRQGVHGEFADTLAEISAQTRTMKDDPLSAYAGLPVLHFACRSLPLPVLLKGADFVYRIMSVGMTNLGNIACAPLAMGGVVPDGGMFLGPVKRKPSVQVSAASFDGECALAIGIRCARSDVPLLQQMLDGMAAEIIAFSE